MNEGRMRSATRKRALISVLRNGGHCDGLETPLATLPVAASDEAKKRALVRELKDIARLEERLYRRKRTLADKLDQLPVEKKLLK